ncbi:hypothetical protein [Geothrix sp. SG200]|uniref:hypothetical protein n=1 Tax=Geothrix sp. SG200 TaxID=2922865 RepID=UPI001FAB8802|nr:hypothetical protein [Geothrix sp. SG200]
MSRPEAPKRGRGRPSKLSDRDRAEILRRLALGETPASLCGEFRVSRSRFSELFSEKATMVREVATRLADVEREVEALPISEMISVRTLADQLKDLGQSLVTTATLNGRTAEIMAGKAVKAAERLGETPTLEDLRLPGAYIEVANKGTALGVSLMNQGRATTIAPEQRVTLEELVAGAKRQPPPSDGSLAEILRKARLRAMSEQDLEAVVLEKADQIRATSAK